MNNEINEMPSEVVFNYSDEREEAKLQIIELNGLIKRNKLSPRYVKELHSDSKRSIEEWSKHLTGLIHQLVEIDPENTVKQITHFVLDLTTRNIDIEKLLIKMYAINEPSLKTKRNRLVVVKQRIRLLTLMEETMGLITEFDIDINAGVDETVVSTQSNVSEVSV